MFSTPEPLSERASNGLSDIYEWHEGRVALISSGSSSEPDRSPVITPSGDDIFFISAQGLVPGDTDGAPDIYDARIGDGFPLPPAEPERCRGDACQGPLSVPAPLLVPGSVSQAPGENVAAPVVTKAVPKSNPKTRHGKKAKHKKKKGHSPRRRKAKKSLKGSGS